VHRFPANFVVFSLTKYRKEVSINILERPSPDELIFELIGVDTSFANALRRILLSEVPVVAFEHVYMLNNTSIIHDEVLAHRIGLIPLCVDPRLLDDFEVTIGDDGTIDDEGGEPGQAAGTSTDRNTVVFSLAVTCPSGPLGDVAEEDDDDDDHSQNEEALGQHDHAASQPPDEYLAAAALAARGGLDQEAVDTAAAAAKAARRRKVQYGADRPYTLHVYSKDLVWVPQGDQLERLGQVRPVHDDILLAKLRPGQTIELEAHGRRGIGQDHAKYSPVATASYRLCPHVELRQPVYDELADELVHVYEPGVFNVVPCRDGSGHDRQAVVVNPRASTMSRNYMRNPILKDAIRMSRIPDHFIFSIESVGNYPGGPAILLAEALRILQQKCQNVIDLLDETTTTVA
jgi:DNA-directed RNA polymerases I and III subunit RPAC1